MHRPAVLPWLPCGRAIKKLKPYTLSLPQEARALRFAPPAARAVALRGAFCHGGHVCLVLQRLFPSLLDYVVDSAALAPAARLANLRALALQLLVRARKGFDLGLGYSVSTCMRLANLRASAAAAGLRAQGF